MQRDFNAEACWVNLRASLPNNEFDLVRWHKDQGYFEDNEKAYKLVFPIMGLPTRFAEAIDAERYDQLDKECGMNNTTNYNINPEEFKKEDIRIRTELMATVQEMQPPGSDQAVIYCVNNDKDSKIHSEPKIDNPRIFMQVLPGSEKQIGEWKKRAKN